jgi:hypothetical protein
MRPIESLTEAWLQRRGSSTRDLYALGILGITVKGHRAFVVPGIIGVLLLASLKEGEWFKQRPAVRPRRCGSAACASARHPR